MPKVLFLQDRIVQDENRDDEEKRTMYRAGEVYNLDQASADRWILRGVATDDPAKIAEAEKPQPRRAPRAAPSDSVQGVQAEAEGTVSSSGTVSSEGSVANQGTLASAMTSSDMPSATRSTGPAVPGGRR